MFTLIQEMLRPEPMIRLKPGFNPYKRDTDTERQWRLAVKINNARRLIAKKLAVREAA